MTYIRKEIGGRERGFKFNQYALEIFTLHLDQNAIKTSSIYATFYAGLRGNCYVKNEDPDFTFEDVVEWVDKLYEEGHLDVINEVNAVWENTFAYREWIREVENKLASEEAPPENKKKARLKRSGSRSTSLPSDS